VGTTFTILLPAIDVELEPDAAESGSIPAFGTETILLVDDEDLIRELGREFLCHSGYKVLTASDGREALELYRTRKEPIGLVILDLFMPHMGGKQCLDELLKIDPQAKVLLASGYFDHDGEPIGNETGAAGFVTKPFDAQGLLRMVRKVLDEP
jgi:DNA-binding NtrC family response regulator